MMCRTRPVAGAELVELIRRTRPVAGDEHFELDFLMPDPLR